MARITRIARNGSLVIALAALTLAFCPSPADIGAAVNRVASWAAGRQPRVRFGDGSVARHRRQRADGAGR